MKREWAADELAEHWTVRPEEKKLLGKKSRATRFGFAVLLKFFQYEGRFPRNRQEVPAIVVDYLSRQIELKPAEWER